MNCSKKGEKNTETSKGSNDDVFQTLIKRTYPDINCSNKYFPCASLPDGAGLGRCSTPGGDGRC